MSHHNRTVCQILPALEGGGVERGTLEIAQALHDASMPSIVISNGGKLVANLDKMGVRHIKLPVHSKNPFLAIVTAVRLHYALKKNKVGLVHVRSRMPAWILKMAMLGLKDITMISTYHGTYGIKPAWIKKRYNSVMLSGEKVIAVSHHIRKHLLENYPIKDEKIVVIHRGADLDFFNPSTVSEDDIVQMANQWGVDRSRPIVLLAGRRTRIKGHKLVMDAIKKINRPDVQCVFVGGDKGNVDYTQELEQYIADNGLAEQVKLIGDCTKMPVAYAVSDIMISATTKPESFGRTVSEAQLMGAVVVAANHGGASETVDDGVTGFHFKPNDADDLAAVLLKALDMTAEQKAVMTSRASDEVKTHFTTEQMCAKTLDLYRQILG